MTNEELQHLGPGDKVYWTNSNGDSENDGCTYLIHTIKIDGDTIIIDDEYGNNIKCSIDKLHHACECEDCDCRGYDGWEFGPGDDVRLCHDCLNEHYPLRSVPQEWIIDNE